MKELFNRKIEEWILVAGFFSLVILVFSQFMTRYMINYSINWLQESSRYLLIWLTWISVSYTIRERKHIRVETLKNMLPEKGQFIVEIIVLLLWSIFALFLALVGVQFVLDVQSSGQGSPMIGIPMWIVYIILPLAGGLMILRLIQQFIFIFRKETEKENV